MFRLKRHIALAALVLCLSGPSAPSLAAESKTVAPPPEAEILVPLLGEKPAGPSLAERAAPPPPPPPPGPICSLSQCDPNSCPLGPNRACLLQTFQDIQWRICAYSSQFGSASNQQSKGYEVGPVYLRQLSGANNGWRQVLYRATPAEVFTPYHSGSPHFYDTQFTNWSNWRRPVTTADAGPNGTLITLSQDGAFGPSLVAECRDRGPAWLCKGNQGSFVRRGQELALWGVFDTGNYDFITEYGFRDDGTITLRTGATGYNNPNQPTDPHMHDVLWRIDMDLNGAGGDTALLTEHREPSGSPPQAADFEVPFNNGVEGFADWEDLEFTSLVVEDSTVNTHGQRLGYAFEPSRTGTARHIEPWTRHDFWVTRWRPAEETGWASPWKTPDQYLFPYISNQESVANADLVLWYLASGHHHPIDEDRDNQGGFAVTLTHWFGLELHPHNFFDANPMGAPAICD